MNDQINENTYIEDQDMDEELVQEDNIEESGEEIQEESQEEAQEEYNPKFVFVTGAFGGLGRAVVSELLKAGYNVFGADLNIDDSIDHESVLPIKMDVTNKASVEYAFSVVAEYTEVLHAVINLAGILYMDSIVEGSEQKLRRIIETNFFGTYHVNQESLPFLAVDTSRIINVSSELAIFSPIPFNGFYSLSKTMVDHYTDILRRELNFLGIRVVKVRAGSFGTDLHSKALSEFDTLVNQTDIYKEQLIKLKKMMMNELSNAKNPAIFGKKILEIVNAKKPKITYELNISKKLKTLNRFSEKFQDKMYLKKVR